MASSKSRPPRSARGFAAAFVAFSFFPTIAVAVETSTSSRHAKPSESLTLLGRADDLIRRCQIEHDKSARYAAADEALEMARLAETRLPGDPRPLILQARALAVSDPDHPEACRDNQCGDAVEVLKRARALDKNGVEAERIASELGITLSRLQRYDEALDEYNRALVLVTADRRPSLHDDDGGKTIFYGNAAETLMALGRLSESIEYYARAIETATAGEVEWQLGLWGLGVAYDRDGQLARARQTIARVLEHDPTMGRLSEDGVFFEPPSDRYYYEGLGHEIAGDYKEAEENFARFRKEVPNSRWAARAEAHLKDLRSQKKGGKGLLGRDAADASGLDVAIAPPEQLRVVRPMHVLVDALRRFEPPLKLCYVRAVRATPALEGRLRIAIEVTPFGWVGPGGYVIGVELRDGIHPLPVGDARGRSMSRCVEQSTKGWRFPAVPASLAGGNAPAQNEAMVVSIDFHKAAKK